MSAHDTRTDPRTGDLARWRGQVVQVSALSADRRTVYCMPIGFRVRRQPLAIALGDWLREAVPC